MSTIDIVRENFKARTEIQGELRQIDEAATKDQRDYTDDEKATIAEKRSTLEAIDSRIQANLEQQVRSEEIASGMDRFLGVLADRESGDVHDTRSIGQRFASEEYRTWAQGGARGISPAVDVEMDFRAVTNVTTADTSGGALTPNQRLGRIGQDFLDRRNFLIDLLPSIRVTNGSVEVVQDQSPLADLADAATTVAEGAAKPQAGPTLAVVNEPIQTIAAWANITRQAAADSPMVMDYLDGRLRYAAKRRADAQVISGNGTSPNISGLTDRTGINTYAPAAVGTEDTAISIRKMITQMEQDEAVPEIVVLNPSDAEQFDLTNYDTAGLHAVPNVAGAGARTAWGLTQVRSTAVAAGTAILIDPMAVAVLDRQQVTAYMTDSHASNFTSNILTLLLELRLGLAVFEPAGVGVVTFDYTA